MIELTFILASFLAMYLVHEAGHVLVAWSVGWKIVRVHVHPLGGLGFAYDMRGQGKRLPMVALGGLIASLLLAAVGIAFMPGLYAQSFAIVNLVMFAVQCAPIPGSDGWQIVRSLRRA